MTQGWQAPIQEPERNAGNPLFEGTRIFRVSHHEGQNSKKVCLLDDNPMVGYRHKINTYPLGRSIDIRAKDIRMACASATSKDPDPRTCVLCEAMLRHGDIVKRFFTANLTIIDETGYYSKKNNRQVTNLKNLLELDFPYYKVFEEQKKVAPGGTIAGMRFNVMRPSGDPTRTKTFGDAWTPLGIVNPMEHFWRCDAIPHLIEFAKNKGRTLSWEEAVRELTTPVDYMREVNNYDANKAGVILQYALAKDYTASGSQSQGGGYQQGGGAPSMPAHAAPNYSTQAPPQQQQAPAGFQQPAAPPMQAPPMQAPPMQAPPAQAAPAMQAPPMQAPQQPPQVHAPAGATQMAPPMQAPAMPAQQQQQAPAQSVDGYSFDQQPGWSSAFPGQQQAPAQAPAQAPQQAPAMQAPPMPAQAPAQAPQQAPAQATGGPVLPNVTSPF
jgi:hypothetical protein